MAWWIVAAAWAACSIFVFQVFLKDYQRTFKRITRGDVALLLYLAAHGPIAIPAALITLAGDKPSKWFSQEVGSKKGRGK